MYRYILLFTFCISAIFNLRAQTSFEAIASQGIELHDKGDYEGAIRVYKQGLKSYPESMLLYYEIALSYLAMENYQETINWSEKALKATDELQNVSIVYALLGSAYDNQGKPEEALKIFNESIAKSGDDYILYFNKGVTLQKLDDIKGAADAYLMALLLNPRHLSSNLRAGDCLVTLGLPGLAFYNYCFFLLFEPGSERSIQVIEEVANVYMADGAAAIAADGTPYILGEMNQMIYQNYSISIYDQLYNTLSALAKFDTEPGITDIPGIYLSLYIPFFQEMVEKKQLGTYCRRTTALLLQDSRDWLDQHTKEVTDFHLWVNEFWNRYTEE